MSSASQTHRRAPPGFPEGHLVRVYVWDLVVRSTHWLIVLSLLLLTVTGVFIGDPFLVAPGTADAHSHMQTMKMLHLGGSIVFSMAVVVRIVWMFVGSRWARWTQFIPVEKSRRKGLWGTFLFYILVRKRPPPAVGHNPLAGATYVVVFGLYLAMIFTGLALYAVDHPESAVAVFAGLLDVLGGAQTGRFLHHLGMWLLLGFFAHHVASAVLMSVAERNGVLGSIFGGHKWFKREDLEEIGEDLPEEADPDGPLARTDESGGDEDGG